MEPSSVRTRSGRCFFRYSSRSCVCVGGGCACVWVGGCSVCVYVWVCACVWGGGESTRSLGTITGSQSG